ncbi:MAG TPA: hypothetical protein DCO72_03925 [Ruminococcus sp.]|nr:hypothetical protein [Ruminococcus sp.]
MNDIKIAVSIGDKLIDTIHVSCEPVEQPKYDMKRVLKYALYGIDVDIKESANCCDIGIEANRISELIQLRKVVSKELKELSDNGKAQS